ncbi:hypothetical protein F5148DRAFT_1291549 [Russula earlei]|uniref:Uncharacterized protein n=1 Tax=Russula earlei TaxID=71964 RepID=A0ACC0TW35_9AGAM|nr:hypothetical protein F5148DRAFT_1291549 [Russula earlei]
MNTVAITTSQNIELDYDLASLGDRIVATLIDLGIMVGYMIILIFSLSVFAKHETTDIVVMIIAYLPLVFYSVLSEIFFNGQSVGKRVMKVKVISLDGAQASIGQYIIRWLFRIIDLGLFGGLIAVITVAITERRQRIGDLVAGTTLIKTVPRVALEQTLYTPVVDTNYRVTYPEVIHLKDNDMQLVKEVLNNVQKTGNTMLALQAMRKVEETLQIRSQHEPVTFLYAPFSKLFSLWNLQQEHYYASETATVRGKAIVYCGDEKALTKKMVKDEAKKLPGKQTQPNNPVFQAIAQDFPAISIQVWPSVTTLLYPTLPNKPVKVTNLSIERHPEPKRHAEFISASPVVRKYHHYNFAYMKRIIFLFISILLCTLSYSFSQSTCECKVYDALSKEPLANATITVNKKIVNTTSYKGICNIQPPANAIITISLVGYANREIVYTGKSITVGLQPKFSNLTQVVVSASRIAQQRTEAPVAIATISQQTIQDTRASRLDYLANKVSGVFMVNLGNEQHEMSIRQPMTTRSLFLYLEDGIPIRTTGIYNHNALLEMNMAAAKQIEIIKGPASSLYGAEAIGGAINVITQAPPAVANGMVSVQASNNGYKRTDAQAGNTWGKFDQTNYHKTAFTVRGDYRINNKTTWSNSITYVDYYSDMGGGSLDSTHFAQKNYTTQYTFNYRKTNALRIRSQLTHQWNSNSETQVTLAYRNNSVKQNPSYYVTNNPTNTSLAKRAAQHVQKIHWLNSRLVAGVCTDISPSTYVASYIRIQRDSKGNYVNYTPADSLLSNYKTGISNLASYLNYEVSPVKRLKLVAAIRYDFYHYNFVNYLPASASTGAPSTANDFNRVTPKIGITYNYKQAGFYMNYSQGYVPPQVTELFNSVKVPYLLPQTFFNYEAGGWLSLLQSQLYIDYSVYLLKGTNEIISVRQDDGSYQNQNAGKTKHQGIEYGITYKPTSEWMIRYSGSNAKHRFVYDVEKGTNGQVDYSGHEMAAAPHFFSNAEVVYKPSYIKGLRVGIEWQHQGSYFLDNANSGKYPGFDVFNTRAGYTITHWELWVMHSTFSIPTILYWPVNPLMVILTSWAIHGN